MTLTLRDYQRDAVAAVYQAWADKQRVAIVEPTGAGKTVIMSAIALRAILAGARVLVLAHRDELLDQAVKSFARTFAAMGRPDLRIGLVKGARREVHGVNVIVASVQSLRTDKALGQLTKAGVSVVMVDECHHSTAPSYLKVMRHLGCFDQATRVRALGVTATMSRGDGAALGEVWEDIVHRTRIQTLIARGFLRRPRGIRVKIAELDMGRVKVAAGDYQAGDLGRALEANLAIPAMCRAYAEHAKDRQGIAFWPTVEVAQHAVQYFAELGITALPIWGAMKLDERRATIARFRAGEVQVLSNCGVLTEGTDLPMASAALMGRQTKSAGLYVQMGGRVLRVQDEPAGTWPIHTDALIIDCVGVGARHRLATIADLSGGAVIDVLDRDELDDMLDEFRYEEDDFEELGQGGAMPFEDDGLDGPLVHEDLPLFEESPWRWQQTGRGVWFLHAGARVVFLAPSAERGDVDVCEVSLTSDEGRYVTQAVSMAAGRTIGEELAESLSGGYEEAHGSATWRKAPARADQLMALGYSMIDRHTAMSPAGVVRMTCGEADDLLKRQAATARIDGLAHVAQVTERGYW